MASIIRKREVETMDLLEQLQNLPPPSVETPALPFLPPPYPMQVEADGQAQPPTISTPPQSPSPSPNAQVAASPPYQDVVSEKISYPNMDFDNPEPTSRSQTAGVSSADDKISKILSLFPNSHPASTSQTAMTEMPPAYRQSSTVNNPFGAVDSIQAAGSIPAPTTQVQSQPSSPQVPHVQATYQPQTSVQLQHIQLQTSALQQHIQAQHVSQQQAIQVQLQQQQQIQQLQQQHSQIQQIAQQQNQQVTGMVSQMQGYFDKITRFMETVDRRLTNLENVTRDILKNQTQSSPSPSVLNINTPIVSDFRMDPVELATVKKMQEQYDIDAEVAKKIQAEYDQEFVQDLQKGPSKKTPPPPPPPVKVDQKTPIPPPVAKKTPKDPPKDSKPGEPKEACPICSTMVGISMLEDHVNGCLDGYSKGISDMPKISDEKKGFWSSLFGSKKDDSLKVDSSTMTPPPTQTVPVKPGSPATSSGTKTPVTTSSSTSVSGTPMPALQPSTFVPPQYQTPYNPPLYHDPSQQQYSGHPNTFSYPYIGQQPIYYYVPQQPQQPPK